MEIRTLILAGASVLALAACGKNAEVETEAAADAEVEVPSVEEVAQAAETEADKLAAASLAKAEAFLKENAKQAGVKVTDSGLQFKSLEAGDGASPAADDYVTVHYTGTRMDGSVFDSSVERGEPVTFPLDQVIDGWKEGLMLMKEGEKAQFTMPPALGYGADGTGDGTIGPNEAITFEVELIEVIAAKNQDRYNEVMNAARERYMAKLAEVANENAAKAQSFLDDNAKMAGVQETESGLQYKVLEEGAGEISPVEADQVEVHYSGKLLDGTEFDSSYVRGQTTTFPLSGVIPGWTEGLQLMKEGDKFRFFIPPELAYGQRGKGPIGPNELLIFDVELVDVKDK